MNTTTVRDLIDELEGFDPDAEVRLAVQPNYPFQHYISTVAEVDLSANECSSCGGYVGNPDDAPAGADIGHNPLGCDGDKAQEANVVVYIAEGGQHYDEPYLPGAARDELDW